MKKLFALFVAAGILAFMACGGSDKDAAKAKQDSINKADSIAKVVDKAKQDSIKVADSLAAADTLKPKEGPQGPGQQGPGQQGPGQQGPGQQGPKQDPKGNRPGADKK